MTAAIRRVIEDDRYPHAPRLDPLRAALARLDAAAAGNPAPVQPDVKENKGAQNRIAGNPAPASKPIRPPKAPLPAKADKRARR